MSEKQKLRKYIGPGYASLLKTAFVGTLALTAEVSADAHAGSALATRGTDTATGETPVPDQQSRAMGNSLRAVSAEQYEKHLQAYHDKVNNPPFYFEGPKEAPSSAETLQSSMETHQREQDKHPSSHEEEMATLKAVAEKAGKDPKFADRVTQVLAGRRLLSEQKSIAEAPQVNSAEAPHKSAEAPQKSNETEQKDVGMPCLLSGPQLNPPTTVEGDWTDESVTIIAELNTWNGCENTISGVYFNQQGYLTCPGGCTSGDLGWISFGDPSSIGFAGISKAGNIETVSCKTSDGENVAPTSVTFTVQPIGISNGQETLGSFNTYFLTPPS